MSGRPLPTGEKNGASNSSTIRYLFLLTGIVGDIIQVKLMGQPVIIVNSARVMAELDRKGSTFSDRPRLEFAGELVGYSKTLVLLPYGARFRNYRKYIAKMIGSVNAVKNLSTMEEVETHRFLKRMLAHPESLVANLRKFVAFV